MIVRHGCSSLKLHMRTKDLYLIAFENSKMEKFYVGEYGLSKDNNSHVFSDFGNYDHLGLTDNQVEPFSVSTVTAHFGNLINYSSEANDNDSSARKDAKKSFATMCVLVSEAIRFNERLGKEMVVDKIFNGIGASAREILTLAKNWSTLSGVPGSGVTCPHKKSLEGFTFNVGPKWENK
ncbi:ribosome-inactivating family protein [Microbulbifer sp. ANSA002]|uniref:ribosome-inactivating family protein n=1 Tax=unclassified Microbulbifer TaxID=2619833 RepID=UPI00404247E1